MYSSVIWDLDGTIINSKQGVFNSLQYALEQMNYENIPTELPEVFIGPPLQKSFKELFGFNEKQTLLAIELFREYYGKSGIYENFLFEGITELFENLHNSGIKIYVATSKLEKYARLILEYLEVDKYIDDLIGAEAKGNHTKAELIQELIDKYRIDKKEVVMIGDTHFDLIGANECEIDSIAVGYGFGNMEKLMECSPTYFFETVEELAEFLIGLN